MNTVEREELNKDLHESQDLDEYTPLELSVVELWADEVYGEFVPGE